MLLYILLRAPFSLFLWNSCNESTLRAAFLREILQVKAETSLPLQCWWNWFQAGQIKHTMLAFPYWALELFGLEYPWAACQNFWWDCRGDTTYLLRALLQRNCCSALISTGGKGEGHVLHSVWERSKQSGGCVAVVSIIEKALLFHTSLV